MNYIAGLYLRISRDDGEKGQSESIKNQGEFLMRFAQENGFTVFETYIDDGFSGTSFNRPAFQNMIQDIEDKKINMVLTKDLSRLGRDYILTGHYLERYFPSKNIRYIAVNDGIDTSKVSSDDMSPFKAVINDFYARDISNKVRTALTTKKQLGQFIGSTAPYGYRKDSQNKNKLIIDEETSVVVKEIFDLFLQGNSITHIARLLTNQGVVTPSKRKNPQGKNISESWNETIIKRILTSETYIGNLVQNKSRKINYKVDKKVNLPREDWIVIPDTHQAIIKEEDFKRVQRILDIHTYKKGRRGGKEHLLSGLLFCKDCGMPMTFVSQGNRGYAICKTWKKCSTDCTSHCIREDFIEDIVKIQLNHFSFMKSNTSIDYLDRDMVCLYIQNIYVSKDKKIEIKFQFKDLFK